MHVEFFVVPSEASDAAVRDRTAVVIDVLRACTSIAAAFQSGAEKVIPAESVVAATRLLSTLDRDHALLCGEREGKKVSGFDLGNSPSEYSAAAVRGKTLVFASTNGSKALARTTTAHEVLVCSFVNLSAVCTRLLATAESVAIILAGQSGRFSLEDAVCGGQLLSLLRAELPDIKVGDGGAAAELMAAQFDGDLLGMLRRSSHGSYLESIGFGEDLLACAALDSIPVVPVCREGRIVVESPSPAG
jgi:2-phosphosulfolactate phosphatase